MLLKKASATDTAVLSGNGHASVHREKQSTITSTYRFLLADVIDYSNKSIANQSQRRPTATWPMGALRGHGDLRARCKMPDKFVHPGAVQASTHGSEGRTPSGTLLNVPQIANHGIGVSYSDAHYVEPPAENHPTEGLGISINARPYQWISYRLVDANNTAPEKVLHNQLTLEQFQTEPTHGPSLASCPG